MDFTGEFSLGMGAGKLGELIGPRKGDPIPIQSSNYAVNLSYRHGRGLYWATTSMTRRRVVPGPVVSMDRALALYLGHPLPPVRQDTLPKPRLGLGENYS